MSGRVTGPSAVSFKLVELPPCVGDYSGTATIDANARTLGGADTGTGCNGPVSASFVVGRE